MESEERASQQGAPPRQTSGGPFGIVLLEAMAMVMQMGDLNRMHRSKHQDAEREKDQIVLPTGEPKAIMLSVLGFPQTVEKEIERSEQAPGPPLAAVKQ